MKKNHNTSLRKARQIFKNYNPFFLTPLSLLFFFATIFCCNLKGQAPQLSWAKSHPTVFGVSSNCLDVTADNLGNSIMVGVATGTGTIDFNSTIASDDITISTSFDPFTFFSGADGIIAKYNPLGNCIWSIHIQSIGTSTFETTSVTHVSCDALNNIYVIGKFGGTIDCDPGPSTSTYSSTGDFDIFIAKYDPNGNYIYSFVLGGAGVEEPAGIVCANNNSFHLAFTTTGGAIDLDAGLGSHFPISSINGTDMVICNYSLNGSFNWGQRIGGTGKTNVNAICTDFNNDVIVTGSNSGGTIDFDPGPGTVNYSTHSSCINNAFVAKYSNLGAFVWIAHFNNTIQLGAKHWGNSVTTDALGNVYACGHLGGITDVDPSSSVYNLTPTNVSDAFLLKYDVNGNLNWANMIGSTNYVDARDILFDNTGSVYVAGQFFSTLDLDPSVSAYTVNSINGDAFLSKYQANNGAFLFGSDFVSGNSARAYGLAINSANELFIGGVLGGTMDFDFTTGTNNLTGSFQFFIAKYTTSVLGVAENEIDVGGTLYPNPASEYVKINTTLSKDMSVRIFDLSGKEILNQKIENTNDIDLRKISEGYYFVVITYKNNKRTIPLIIKQ